MQSLQRIKKGQKMTDTPAKKKRGPPPQDPAHGALSPTERSARHRKQLAAQVQQATARPATAHTLPTSVLMRALQGQLAQIDTDSTATRHPAAALVVAIVSKYRLPLFVSLEAPIDTRLAQIAT